MVLGSFQCRGVLLLWHMVGQGPAVLAAGARRVGCFVFFCLFVFFFFCFCCFVVVVFVFLLLLLFSSHLSYLPFLMPNLLEDGWTY